MIVPGEFDVGLTRFTLFEALLRARTCHAEFFGRVEKSAVDGGNGGN